jgi:DNA polymerase-3 subunit epsilon
MYLFLDTETTGLPRNFNASVHDTDNWPRMVQIAFLHCNESGKVLKKGGYIIKPEGFEIPREVVRIHGITTKKALKEGIPLARALDEFSCHMEKSEIMVSHNVNFDYGIVGAELSRKGFDESLAILEQIDKFCTMKGSVEFCKIPGSHGFKWPKLSELHRALFKKDFSHAHNAEKDVEICRKCFFKLKEMGKIRM